MDNRHVPVTAIDAFVQHQMMLGRIPGLAVVICAGPDIVHERGYGFANMASGEAMTEHSRVIIGSTTKAMTALAILQLVERGLMSLDDPVQRYIPTFRLGTAGAAEQVTVLHALTHTAGLPPTPTDGPSFVGSSTSMGLQQYIDELAQVESLWPPGDGWVYANDGYALAGRVIEIVSGLPYTEYMANHVFGPLGLKDVKFASETTPHAGAAIPYDFDHTGRPYPSFWPDDPVTSPAGMAVMNAHEVGRWLGIILNGGEWEGRRVASAASIAAMMEPLVRESPSTWYGLGWSSGEMHGVPAVWHNGTVITMGSHFVIVPERQMAVGVVANSSTQATSIVAEGIVALLLGREPVRSFPSVDASFEPDRRLWPLLEGVYHATVPASAVSSPLPIHVTDTGLVASTYPASGEHRPGDVFLSPLDDLDFVLFGRGKTGSTANFTIDGSDVQGTFQGVPLKKVASRVHRGTVVRWAQGER